MLFNSEVNAQTKPMRVSIKVNLKVDTTKVRLYDKIEIEENENIKTIVLKMRYGSSEILNPKAAKVLEKGGCKVLSVDIVYTDYNNNDVQNTLNKKRLMELYFLSPDIFNQKLVKWKYIEQLGYSTEEVARGLFHGIVIKYVKVPVYKPTSLEEMFGNLKVEKLGDTSLFKLFEKHVKFDEELICADLTGSMSPYYFQVFAWLNLKHNPKKLNYSFFNDGDNTPDYLKKRGRVGGIYLCKTSSVDTMTSLAYNCIVNGNGGDSPENNIESILKGVKEYPETKEIIMLADNWANMRDYSLISRVKIPVKVIVCGTNLYGIKTPVNSEYLDLARRTGGSVHTIEEDILDLAKKKEGDVITVGGVKYQIRGGRFIKR
jgi:hypothetical protein